MAKLELNIINYPYISYGIITENHINDKIFFNNSIDQVNYNKLYNNCLIDISKKIYRGKTFIKDNILEVKLDSQYIKNMTRDDLKIIRKVGIKLYDNISYDNLKEYYTSDLYPLPQKDKKIDKNLKNINNFSYPLTHYEFFKYEDFDIFNFIVYYRYISHKYKQKFNKDAPCYDEIKKNISRFNKLILEIKVAFNRIRPYQASFIEKIPIKTYITYAGQTPSIPSGHSLYGFLFGALIFYKLKNYFDSLEVDELKCELDLLIRISKDIGHRRIMAGVHYPSDMLGSWIIFENIIKFLKIDDKIIAYYDKLKINLTNF
jgi:hypothetical protein